MCHDAMKNRIILTLALSVNMMATASVLPSGAAPLSPQEVESLGLDQVESLPREAAGTIVEASRWREGETKEERQERYRRMQKALDQYNAIMMDMTAERGN